MDVGPLLDQLKNIWQAVKPHVVSVLLQLCQFLIEQPIVAVVRLLMLSMSLIYLSFPALLTLPFAWVTSVVCLFMMLGAACVNVVEGGYDAAKLFAALSSVLFIGLTFPFPFVNLRVLGVVSLAIISSFLVSIGREFKLADVSDVKSIAEISRAKVFKLVSIKSMQNSFSEILFGEQPACN